MLCAGYVCQHAADMTRQRGYAIAVMNYIRNLDSFTKFQYYLSFLLPIHQQHPSETIYSNIH